MNLILLGILFLTFGVLVQCSEVDERPLITIEDGNIKGTFKTSFNGRKYMAFEGIPYAKPPIQNLRFKGPEPADPWPGILDATTSYTCIQLGLDFSVTGQEDCLYVNVYVPRETIDPEEKLDVIVHIHGGAYMVGSPTLMSGPLYLMDRDIVYVNFNYRLGPFGFFNAGDKTFHANHGLKDQALLLEWVQKNIGHFGGNSSSVTLTGLSAGAASVHMQYFSFAEEKLFHRGFAQSGTGLNPWAVRIDQWPTAKVFAEEIGCMEDGMIIFRCMKQRSALQMINAVKKLYKAPLIPLTPFAPSTEVWLPLAFMNAIPYLQLASNVTYDVPLLISMTTEEGTLPAALFYNKIDELNANWSYWLPLILEYYDHPQEEKDEVSAKIKEFYFKNENVTKENFATFIKLCTHRLFHLGAEKAAKMQASFTESDIYFLLMGYAGEEFIPMPQFGLEVDWGVGHGMDAKFYYEATIVPIPPLTNKREIEMKDILLDMLVSYAKTGKPTVPNVEFKPVPKDGGNLRYLYVKGPDNISMKSIKRLGPQEFWRSLGLKEEENMFKIGKNFVQIV